MLGRNGRGNAAFDGRRFLANARTGRRYDRFVGQMVRQIGSREAHRSFAFVAAQRPRVGGGAVAQSVEKRAASWRR